MNIKLSTVPSIKHMPKKWWLKTALVKNHKEKYNSKENMLVKKDSESWFGDLFLASFFSEYPDSVIPRRNLAQCLMDGLGGRGLCLNPVIPLLAVWPVEVTLPLSPCPGFFIYNKENNNNDSNRK